MPVREPHHVTGRAVELAQQKRLGLEQLTPYSRAQDAVDEFFRAGLTVTAVLPGGEGLSFMTPGWRSKRGIPGLVLQAIRS